MNVTQQAAQRPPELRMLFDPEMFVDGFAGGGGASKGTEWALGRSPDIAINHDREALAMHKVNHPRTRHIRSNIRKVRYGPLVRGWRVAGGWFSPDCTYFSKARGKKPFRDRNKARRIRGLAWEVLRFAIEVKAATGHYPRVLFMENVEEIRDWCPLDKRGNPIWSKRGKNFDAWVARWKNLGAVVEWKELRASWYGAATSRKRLFVIIRFDGEPIVWPERTHGPNGQAFDTAAEHIDFSIPVPSIFLTKTEAKAWGKAHGVPTPRRPLVVKTKRRIARGVMRYVVNCADPFIIAVRHQDDSHIHPVREPLTTIPASDREHALVEPVFAPFLTEHANGSTQRNFGAAEPLRTICAGVKGGHFALVAPTLIQTRNGERDGQAPRTLDIRAPYNTITAHGSQGALVAGFLAKHNGGHEATGQKLPVPIDAVTTRDTKALVTSSLVKFRGGLKDHKMTAQDVREPAPALTAGGTHLAEVRTTLVPRDSISAEHVDRAVQTCAFLVKFFGTGVARRVDAPADTITTKDRVGLVTVVLVRVGDAEYVLVDIGMRMLTPRELFSCQGFPADYAINVKMRVKVRGKWVMKWLTKKSQTRLVGNSVAPHVAMALVRANLPDLALRYAA